MKISRKSVGYIELDENCIITGSVGETVGESRWAGNSWAFSAVIKLNKDMDGEEWSVVYALPIVCLSNQVFFPSGKLTNWSPLLHLYTYHKNSPTLHMQTEQLVWEFEVWTTWNALNCNLTVD